MRGERDYGNQENACQYGVIPREIRLEANQLIRGRSEERDGDFAPVGLDVGAGLELHATKISFVLKFESKDSDGRGDTLVLRCGRRIQIIHH